MPYIQPAAQGIANIVNGTSDKKQDGFISIDNYIYLYHTKTLISLHKYIVKEDLFVTFTFFAILSILIYW